VLAAEASAVTYNWDTGTLFVLGDEGDALVEVSGSGAQLSSMSLTGFDDTEGLTYIGGGRFVLTEERLRDAYLLPYVASSSADRAALSSADLGTTVGNIGIEGISYDRPTGNYFTVKEVSPQEVNRNAIDFGAGSATVTTLFAPSLGVLDLSDVQVLSGVPALVGTPDQSNLLIYSQESRLLMEVSASGSLLSQFSFSALSSSAEGVTIDPTSGTIYVVDETPNLFVLRPVPEPGSLGLLALGLGALALVRGRRSPERPITPA
jgi:uncharacterized protein YjiK